MHQRSQPRPVPASRSPNLRLLPPLASGLRRSAVEFGCRVSVLVAFLVRNDAIAPTQLQALPAAKLSRVIVGLAMGPKLRALAARGAKRCGISRNAYLEALIAAHLADSGPLVILRSKGAVRL